MRSRLMRMQRGSESMTKYDHARKFAEIARKEWFKDHVVDVREDTGLVTVVDFHRPGTNIYAVRYIFAGHYVYVSGDLGSAVFNCTWPVTPTGKHWNDRWYIFGKLEAARKGDFDEFDSEVCVTEIRNTLLEKDKKGNHTRYPENWDESQKKTYRELIKRARECNSQLSWSTALADLNASSGLYELDECWWEWLDGAGTVMAPNIVGIIEGLTLIAEKKGD